MTELEEIISILESAAEALLDGELTRCSENLKFGLEKLEDLAEIDRNSGEENELRRECGEEEYDDPGHY